MSKKDEKIKKEKKEKEIIPDSPVTRTTSEDENPGPKGPPIK